MIALFCHSSGHWKQECESGHHYCRKEGCDLCDNFEKVNRTRLCFVQNSVYPVWTPVKVMEGKKIQHW